MANADITKPVIINATTSALIQSADFMRRVVFVSCGESVLPKGEYTPVIKADYTDFLQSEENELAKRLLNFFAFASNKTAYILEVGAYKITPANPGYDNLLDFDKTIETFKMGDFLTYIYEKWKNNETEDILKSWLTTQAAFVESNYTQWLTDNGKGASSLANLQEYAKTLSLDTYPINYYENLSETQDAFQALMTYENLLAFSKDTSKLQGWTQEAYDAYLVTIGTVDNDFSEKIKDIADFIENGNLRAYIYALPKPFIKDEGTAGLTKSYIDTNSKQYFALEVEADTDLTLYKGQKSVWAINDNGRNKDNNAVGAVLGKFASSNFDISASLKASPMNYKFLTGFAYTELENRTQRSFIENNVSYISSKAGNTLIMNGRCMDTRPIDYWYQWDLASFSIENAVITLLLNGVNNPNYAIQYNQNGIDTINASIVATLNTMISYGCITEFGASFNTATNELENIGYIYAVDYYTYIANQPQDYQNEVYQGFSFYVRVGRYIRQVVLNVTLN